MQAPRLVATDVDGTLLDNDERVSVRAAAVVGRLTAAGVGFVLVTGRPPRWIPPVVQQLGVARLAVCANGAVLYDAVEDRVLWARQIAPETLIDLAAAAAEALPGCGLAVERVGTGAFDDAAAQFVAEPDYRHAWPNPDNASVSRSELLARPAVKLLIRAPEMTSGEMVAALRPLVGDAVDLTFSNPRGLVEASPPGITKATGLAEVAQGTGVDTDGVIAFGDMPNDLEMLRWAGHGVAMGNAHPTLFDVADEVTASNVDDGLALVLERWF
ncbi:Cof-type HAD-IIB family hydrolase [Pseudonocardia asaccharolytica]|uniref:Cof-type HAD-IIB family hydrolase n=1 Tax=Pseudonocardia asaccharolytica TaxID=54010 RepID=UPI00042815C7|nr:Cof-type HAD-IIB family hydrolase [Pseudonocardia asaccharolytica]